MNQQIEPNQHSSFHEAVISRPQKTFLVRFQQVRIYSIEIEANNADEADILALEAFEKNEGQASLLHTNIGHMTVETISK